MKSFIVAVIVALSPFCVAQISEDFEGSTIAGLEADGWVFTPGGALLQYARIETAITHSGSNALALPQYCLAALGFGNQYGRLNIWVYDNGDVYSGYSTVYGPCWGISKGINWIGGSIQNRAWLPDNLAYSVSFGGDGDRTGGGFYSPSYILAGLGGDEDNRGQAGWMNWEITYHPDGKIQIDLLSDPNGCDSRRHPGELAGNPSGRGLPRQDGTFASDGGAEGIYLFGSRHVSPLDASQTAYGDLIVDDITWTPLTDYPGDVNLDGDVDITDALLLRSNYGTESGATWSMGDFDYDGDVDIDDFYILQGNYGFSSN